MHILRERVKRKRTSKLSAGSGRYARRMYTLAGERAYVPGDRLTIIKVRRSGSAVRPHAAWLGSL